MAHKKHRSTVLDHKHNLNTLDDEYKFDNLLGPTEEAKKHETVKLSSNNRNTARETPFTIFTLYQDLKDIFFGPKNPETPQSD